MKLKVQSSKLDGSSKFQVPFALLIFWLASYAAAFAQNPPSPPANRIEVQSGGSIIIQSGGGSVTFQGGPIIIRGGQVIQLGTNGQPLDPLISLMMSQPQIDTNDVKVIAEFDPPAVPLGQRATYRLIVTAMAETIRLPEKLPAPAGLQLEEGAKAQAFQNLGGMVQARSTFNFRAQPAAPGGVVMPAFTLTVGRRKISVPEARLTVLSPSAVLVPGVPRLSLEVATNGIYVGESLPVKLVLTDPGDNSVLALTQAHVVGDGLLAEPGFGRMIRAATMRDGQSRTTVMSEVLVTPMREGRLSVFGQANAILNRPTDFRYATLPGYYPLLDTDPITLDVRRVPKAGELPGYTGAIGAFAMDPPQFSTQQLRAGDPLMMQVVVRGEGNFGRFTPPKPPADPDWQIFAATTEANPGNQMQRQGYAAFTYTLIPLSDRVNATPTIAFSAFDPEQKTYVDLTIRPVPVKVAPAPGGVTRSATVEAPRDPDGPEAEPVLALAGVIEKLGASSASLVPLQARGGFLALQLLPALALGGLWWWDQRRRFLAAHPEVILKRRARRALSRALRQARRAASANDSGEYVNAAVKALRAAAAPHNAANPDALVCRDILRQLPEGTAEADEEIVRKLFAAADAGRFANRREAGAALVGQEAEFERVAGKLEERL